MNHLHTYSHLHQTLLLCISHSFLSIGLACKVTRSHASQIHIVRTKKEHSLLAKITAKRRTVGANHGVCWLHKGEQWNYQKGNKFPLRQKQLCIHKSRYHSEQYRYSHLRTAKCLQQGNSRYRAYGLRWHYFTQNDSYNHILMFGPLIQNCCMIHP